MFTINNQNKYISIMRSITKTKNSLPYQSWGLQFELNETKQQLNIANNALYIIAENENIYFTNPC